MDKVCKIHGLTYHFESRDGKYAYFVCSKCSGLRVSNHRRNKKLKLIEMFGGKCIICGYKKYAGSLDFHHLEPSKKSFGLSGKGLSYSWAKIVEEAKKCVLLCKNCHMEVTYGVTEINPI